MFARLPLLLSTVLCLVLSPALARDDAARDLLAAATQTLEAGDDTYLAIGNSVLKLPGGDAPVAWRKAVAGTVSLLEEEGNGVSVVSSLPGGLTERMSIDADGRASSPVRFGTDPGVFSALRQEARAADAEERLGVDPTNPWLYLEMAADAPEEEADEYR